MPEPGRVLHVSAPTVAGVPTVLLGYVEEQLARGWSVSVACPPHGWLAEAATAAGARVFRWPACRSPGPGVVDETHRLARIIAADSPDVVHLHSSKAGLAGRLVIRGKRPTVFQPHAWSFLAVDGLARTAAVAWERLAARWADAVLCVSESERQLGAMHGLRAPMAVIPNGVDCARWVAANAQDRASARQRLGLSVRSLAVCVGRLCDQKGQRDLLDAWDAVRRAVDDAELVLVGDGPDRAMLQARIGDRGDVALVGERHDVGLWLSAADVVVVPSRWEGMALAPLEAMACARSVVVTDVAGAAESVPAGAGAVVLAGDVDGLACEIVVRLADTAYADAEGMAGRRHVETHHDVASSSEAVMNLYSMLLQRRRQLRRQRRRAAGFAAARPRTTSGA